jgi:hypothetical protein
MFISSYTLPVLSSHSSLFIRSNKNAEEYNLQISSLYNCLHLLALPPPYVIFPSASYTQTSSIFVLPWGVGLSQNGQKKKVAELNFLSGAL